MSNDFIRTWLEGLHDQETVIWLRLLLYLVLFLLVSYIFFKILKESLLLLVKRVVERSKTQIDDILFERKTFTWLLQFVPALILYLSMSFIFVDFKSWIPVVHNITTAYVVFTFMAVLISILNSIRDLLKQNEFFRDKPINSYIQVVKIFIYAFGVIGIISLIIGKSPLYFFSALGAVSAVLILVFKDSILGFVASIQIAANDMLRLGDWITFSKYGADGDVIEISLASVLIKNFDLTITSVPTYAFVSDAFKNWRGMKESEGRRIKRAVFIDKGSIAFLTDEQLKVMQNISILKHYFDQKKEVIGHINTADINSRRLTNIGTFRKYLEFYLKNHPLINQDLTIMVRQLETTSEGLPLELYAFSKSKVWVEYEEIISDIFDHIFAIVPYFGLKLYQKPSGHDLEKLKS